MENFKNTLASRTIWALIITLLAMIADIFGFTITGEEQDKLLQLALNATELFGVLAAAYYRIKATKIIGKPPAE